MLRLEGVSKTYDGGETALRDVSFEVDGTEIVGIIGPSGSGKSTLVRCINRLVEPTEGEIYLDGTELTGLSASALRKERQSIAMVFQEYNLVERLTVMENVLSGRLGQVSFWQALRRSFPEADVKEAKALLSAVGMFDQINSRADELSGGQRQRVGVARALIQDPKIVLADEPTSSLDPENARVLLDRITELARESNIPVLVNMHDVPLAKSYGDRIIALRDGAIEFDGPPSRLDEAAQNRIYRGEEPSPRPSTAPDESETSAVEDAGRITAREL